MDKKFIVLVGVVALIAGVFLPVVTVPVVGSINLLQPPGGGMGDGIFILGFAVLAGLLAILGQAKHALWPALAALGFVVYEFINLKGVIDEQAAQIAATPGAAELVDAVGGASSMNWVGWIVLGLGGLLAVVGSVLAWKKTA